MVPIYDSSTRWNKDTLQIIKINSAPAMYHLPLITYVRRITSYEIDVVDDWFVYHSNLAEVEHFRRFEVPGRSFVTIAMYMCTTVSCWHKLFLWNRMLRFYNASIYTCHKQAFTYPRSILGYFLFAAHCCGRVQLCTLGREVDTHSTISSFRYSYYMIVN